MLVERDVGVSYKAIRRWTARFELQIARNLPEAVQVAGKHRSRSISS